MIVDGFFAELPYEPDRFQLEAARAVERGLSVVVTAPTGAGKTLIAEAAIRLALAERRKVFYTTPIKALSNQKYRDLAGVYGDDMVGLLTGDNSINGRAPIVVMTTEVLRNMIYAGSGDLEGLGVAVLDEVHYLADRFRGPVWEEIIIHAPAHVRLVCLSATIANGEEFTAWIGERRGGTAFVEETRRPVPLAGYYMIRDLFDRRTLMEELFVGDAGRRRPNPAIVGRLSSAPRGRRRRYVTPRRGEVVAVLAERGMLPAIYFIFSRAGCESAAETMVSRGIRLTTPAEREVIRRVAEERTAHLDEGDLHVLGYGRWLSQLEAGVAPHHAGMVPAFKETVEDLFAGGRVKLVFATETLALGINMPAKTVVLESLSKFTGEQHELMEPTDYTQLTGRAGRRGIDAEGFGVVLHSPYLRFESVTAIASTGSHPLVSSFRPTYNMAANLIANYRRERAEELLNASFAQFRRDREREQAARALGAEEETLARYRRLAECELGDVWDYVERLRAPDRRSRERTARRIVGSLRPGDVIDVPGGDSAGRYAVLQRQGEKAAEPRLLVVTEAGRTLRIRGRHLVPGTARLGRLDLPRPFRPQQRRYQQQVGRALRSFGDGTPPMVLSWPEGGAARDHPVARCEHRAEHVRQAQLAVRLATDLERRRTSTTRRRESLVREFRRILELLERLGYVEGWALSDKGRRLRFIYNDLDLLLSEALSEGLLDRLDPKELVAFCSAFTYEPRAEQGEGAEWPSPELETQGERLLVLWDALTEAEIELDLAPTRAPEAGFAALAYHWAGGIELEDLLEEDMPPGDFVRNCRQVLDLLRQLRDASGDPEGVIAESLELVDRGVVAAGGVG